MNFCGHRRIQTKKRYSHGYNSKPKKIRICRDCGKEIPRKHKSKEKY